MIGNDRKYLNIIDAIVLQLDRKGKILYINVKGNKILGYRENEILGKNWFKTCIPHSKREEMERVFNKVINGEKEVDYFENAVQTKKGLEKIIRWHNSNVYNKKGNIEGVLSLGTDITRQRKIEKLTFIQGQTNFLISNAKNEMGMFQEFCEEIIQFKNYQFCWIGLVQYDEEKSIKPVALAGYNIFDNSKYDGKKLKFTWSESVKDQSPSGTAIRTRKNYIINDLSAEKKFKNWKTVFDGSGFLSSISIPIIIENIVIGVLGIYSGNKNTFDEDDVELISKMVNNLSLGIAKMRYYKIQKKNEKNLRNSLKKFTTIFQAIPDLFLLLSKKGDVLEFHGDKNLLHVPLDNLLGKDLFIGFPNKISKLIEEKSLEVFKTKKPQVVEFPLKQQNEIIEIFEARLFFYDENKIAVFVRNITESKSRENKLKETEFRLRNLNLDLDQKVELRTRELENSKNQLNIILNTLNYPVFVISEDYEILFHNRSSSKIYDGILDGKICYKILRGREQPCDDMCPLRNKSLSQNIKSLKFEDKLFLSKFDEERDFEISSTKIENFNGKPALLEIFEDITDRKKKEKQILESELMLQVRIKGLKCLYGISSLLVVPDITIKELLYGVLPLIRSSWQYPEITMVKIIYGENQAQTTSFKESEWKLTISDKINDIPLKIEVVYEINKEFLDEEKRLLKEILTRIKLGIISIEYKLETKRLASIVGTSSDSIVSMDKEGMIKSWNKGAERIYGYALEEVLEKSISMLIPPDRMEEIPNLIEKVVQGESYKLFETKRLRKDGKVLSVNVTISPILDLKGDIVGISSISRDVTESLEQQKQYQDQLIKSSQFKSDFMASMSHELRTPLNSIIGFTDILIEKFYGDVNEKQDHYLNNVRTSAEHLLNLINDILDISKIEAGKVELKYRDFDLLNLVSQIEIEVKPLYKKKGLNFELVGFEKGTIINADPIRFKEILLNLLSNAIKYTEKGGIKLDFMEDEKNWKFKIIDTGIGIAPEDFGIIFQEFKRVESDYVESIEGTGLGLMLTKKLIELHGGHITFTSVLGEGSSFSFTLPKKLI
ncbi:PAS domain S-box protein [Promethearchaeum syntrophicum]|uniref:histidine kinase n=1 Tax=Promethearchaeum syntrophicum TaxID=2594042 RepID=A0A5B9DC53_9ARCH|nr:PAS domain S-box protein [Candidatus Prometheoarchaeum syntrophicum]QEE16621.1 aerobic respiration control sensor protein ArcB [Candidatus Prometheoarchaeum syntrophicum]